MFPIYTKQQFIRNGMGNIRKDILDYLFSKISKGIQFLRKNRENFLDFCLQSKKKGVY